MLLWSSLIVCFGKVPPATSWDSTQLWRTNLDGRIPTWSGCASSGTWAMAATAVRNKVTLKTGLTRLKQFLFSLIFPSCSCIFIYFLISIYFLFSVSSVLHLSESVSVQSTFWETLKDFSINPHEWIMNLYIIISHCPNNFKLHNCLLPKLESLVASLGANFPKSAATDRPMGAMDTLPSWEDWSAGPKIASLRYVANPFLILFSRSEQISSTIAYHQPANLEPSTQALAVALVSTRKSRPFTSSRLPFHSTKPRDFATQLRNAKLRGEMAGRAVTISVTN